MDIKTAVENFRVKYDFKPIWAVGADDVTGTIHVYTSDAKVWVDLPAKFEGFQVHMKVGRAPRPAPALAR